MFDNIINLFTHTLGIDFGSDSIKTFVLEKNGVFKTPSVIVRLKASKKTLAMGSEAEKMIGRLPALAEAVRPLVGGRIVDYSSAVLILADTVSQIHQSFGLIPKIPRPKMIFAVSPSLSAIDRKALQDVGFNAGGRRVYFVEKPIAAAVGEGWNFESGKGFCLVDFGAETCEISLIHHLGIYYHVSLKTGGAQIEQKIIDFLKMKYGLLVGFSTAKELKTSIACAPGFFGEKLAVARGRDLESGLPRSLKISAEELSESLTEIFNLVAFKLKEALSAANPELLSDVVASGVIVGGGSSLISGFVGFLSKETAMPVFLAKEPLTCQARGLKLFLRNPKLIFRFNDQK